MPGPLSRRPSDGADADTPVEHHFRVPHPQRQRFALGSHCRAWVTPAQKEAALRFGFRPSDPSVPLKSADANNPFNRLAGNGIKIDLPPVAETPNGSVVRALLTMWSRLVAK